MAQDSYTGMPAGLTIADYGQGPGADNLLDFIPPNVQWAPPLMPYVSTAGPPITSSGSVLNGTQKIMYSPGDPTSNINRYSPTTTHTPAGQPIELGANTWDFGGNRYYNYSEYADAINAFYETDVWGNPTKNTGVAPSTLPAGMIDYDRLGTTWTNPDGAMTLTNETTGLDTDYDANIDYTTNLELSEASRAAGEKLLQDELFYLERQKEEARLKAMQEQYNKPLEDDFAGILAKAEANIVTDKDKWGKAHWDTWGRAEGRTFTDDFGDYVDQYPDLLETYNKDTDDPNWRNKGLFGLYWN